jgi:hypothetical protein
MLDPGNSSFPSSASFAMDKNSEQCEKRMRQQIAHMKAM